MAEEKVFTAALALIKVQGIVIGKMRNIRYEENIRRIPVRGIGSILPTEGAVVEWSGNVSCDFFMVSFKDSPIKNAILRNFSALRSQATNGRGSFEDQLALDSEGIQLDLFKKVTDVIDPNTKQIKPKLEPFATISRCLIESDGFDISEASVSGHSQRFMALDPISFV